MERFFWHNKIRSTTRYTPTKIEPSYKITGISLNIMLFRPVYFLFLWSLWIVSNLHFSKADFIDESDIPHKNRKLQDSSASITSLQPSLSISSLRTCQLKYLVSYHQSVTSQHKASTVQMNQAKVKCKQAFQLYYQ